MKRPIVSLVAATLSVVLPGRAMAFRKETASFSTNKDFAKVYIDGKYVGSTPLELEFECGQVGDRRYRIEHEGCEPAEGILNARVAPGRIVGAAFTVGILLIFRCPQYFEPVRVALRCGGETTDVPVSPADLPPRTNLRRQLRGDKAAVDSDAEIVSRLRTLKDLHDRGVLSDEEYKYERERLLQQLPP